MNEAAATRSILLIAVQLCAALSRASHLCLKKAVFRARQGTNTIFPCVLLDRFRTGIQGKIRYFLTGLSSPGNNKEDQGAGSVPPRKNSSSIAIGFAFEERFVRSWHATCELPDA